MMMNLFNYSLQGKDSIEHAQSTLCKPHSQTISISLIIIAHAWVSEQNFLTIYKALHLNIPDNPQNQPPITVPYKYAFWIYVGWLF